MNISKRIAALQAKAPKLKPDKRNVAALMALCRGLELDAVADPVTYLKSSVQTLAAEMLERMASKALTESDRAMLTELPECEFTVTWLLLGMANQQAILQECRKRGIGKMKDRN